MMCFTFNRCFPTRGEEAFCESIIGRTGIVKTVGGGGAKGTHQFASFFEASSKFSTRSGGKETK